MSEQSVMEQALGQQWQELPIVIQNMYHLPTHTDQEISMSGTMSVNFPTFMYPLILAGRFFGAMISKRGTNITGSVLKKSKSDSNALYWSRLLSYSDGKTIIFNSRMEYFKAGELIEYVRFGLGLKLKVSVVNNQLIYHSNGYTWRPFCNWLKLPDWLFYGHALITEQVVDNKMKLNFTITHPLYGKSYEYYGIFNLS